MKSVFVLFISSILVFGCQKAGKNEPEEELQDIERAFQAALDESSCGRASLSWLRDLLVKAEEDRLSMAYNGHYVGVISMIRYRGNTLFYTDFALGSGGIAYYLFDCDGENIVITGEGAGEIPNEAKKRGNIIYSSLGFL